MRATCTICTDIFMNDSDITITECGHAFHSYCLLQWLERSKTCPQCRRKVTEKKLTKLFLTHSDTIIEFEPDKLQHEVESLRFKLSLKTTTLNKTVEENEKLSEQAKTLRDEVVRLERQVRSKEDTITALKMQLECFSDVSKQRDKSRADYNRLRARLKLLTSVESLVNQTASEVEEMLATYPSDSPTVTRDMATYCVVLKKELTRSTEERRGVGADRHRLRGLLQDSRRDGQQLQLRVTQLERQQAGLEAELTSSEEECQRLQKQVKALESAVASPSGDPRNSALTRLLSERPTPDDLKTHPFIDTAAAGPSAPRHLLDEAEDDIILSSDDCLDVLEPVRRAAAASTRTAPVPSAMQADEDWDSPRVAIATAGPPQSSPLLGRARTGGVSFARTIAAPSPGSALARNPFLAAAVGPRSSPHSSRTVNRSSLKKFNLLKLPPFETATTTVATSPSKRVAPSIRSSRASDVGWDGLGGSSRVETFPQPRPKLKVKLKNSGGKVMRIDNFFNS